MGSAVVLSKYTNNPTEFVRGPWTYELDVIIWYHRDKLCAVLRTKEIGTLNGYVEGERTLNSRVHVHGGITFMDEITTHIEHADLLTGHTFFGFDCAHSGDLIPAAHTFAGVASATGLPVLFALGTYRTVNFAIRETQSMATQLYG